MASTTTSTMSEGIGELSFPDENTVHLKPLLLIKREKLRRSKPLWSLWVPVPPLLLWLLGLNLLLYPLWVLLFSKYREDFQDQACPRVVSVVLDGLATWVLDLCPPVTSALFLFHIGVCLAYTSLTIHRETAKKEKHAKQD